MIYSFLCQLLLASLPGSADPPATAGQVQVNLHNIQSACGTLYLAIYDQATTFEKGSEHHSLVNQVVNRLGTYTMSLNDLSPGQYAIAVYHDVNGNGDLDKNIFGIPKEPYGFSQNPRAKWSAPSFSETAFVVTDQPLQLAITLKTWKDR